VIGFIARGWVLRSLIFILHFRGSWYRKLWQW